MGTDISNLSHTIDIHYRNVDKVKEMMKLYRYINRFIITAYGKNEWTDFSFLFQYRMEELLLVDRGMEKVL